MDKHTIFAALIGLVITISGIALYSHFVSASWVIPTPSTGSCVYEQCTCGWFFCTCSHAITNCANNCNSGVACNICCDVGGANGDYNGIEVQNCQAVCESYFPASGS